MKTLDEHVRKNDRSSRIHTASFEVLGTHDMGTPGQVQLCDASPLSVFILPQSQPVVWLFIDPGRGILTDATTKDNVQRAERFLARYFLHINCQVQYLESRYDARGSLATRHVPGY